MKHLKQILFIFISLIPAICLLFPIQGCIAGSTGQPPSPASLAPVKSAESAPGQYAVIGYIAGWTQRINPDAIPVEKLTHLNYAFAVLAPKEKNHVLVPYHPEDPENFSQLETLKRRNPRVKMLISVGGWDGSQGFSDMALTRENRETFISSAITFIKQYGFDGLDFDWEYPGLPGAGNTYRTEDTSNFTALLRECRAALSALKKKTGKEYLLTMAAGAYLKPLQRLDLREIHSYLNYMNLMTYDFAGSWDPLTGHHSNLYLSAFNPDREGPSAAQAVEYCLSQDFPASKIVVGVAFYGRGWKEVIPSQNGLYQKASGKADGDFSFVSLSRNYINKNGFYVFRDESAKAPYLWNPETATFISYEDEISVKDKCEYVKKRQLGGIMFWQLYEDDDCRLLDAICTNLH